MKGFFEYKVTYWNEFETNEKHPDGQLVEAKGICYAETYSKAVKKIENYYDNIENIFVQGLEPGSCYDFQSDPYFHAGTVLEKGWKY